MVDRMNDQSVNIQNSKTDIEKFVKMYNIVEIFTGIVEKLDTTFYGTVKTMEKEHNNIALIAQSQAHFNL